MSLFGQNKTIARFVILFLLIPVMFFSGSLLSDLSQGSVARVGNIEIPASEFNANLSQLLDDLRRRSGQAELPPEALQHARQAVFSRMMSRSLLDAVADEKQYITSDAELKKIILDAPEFQDEDGVFSLDLYKESIRDTAAYERRLAAQFRAGPVFDILSGNITPPAIVKNIAEFRRHRRVLHVADIPIADIPPPSEVTLPTISYEDVEEYYTENVQEFVLNEEADFEYVVFPVSVFAASITVSDAEVQQSYEDYLALKQAEQQREIRHILFDFDTDDTAIAEIAAKLREDPSQFAAIAKEQSTDYGSASQGGRLGVVLPGDLPAELEAVAFSLEPNQISEPVSSDAGIHLLMVDDIESPDVPALEELYDEMVLDARLQKSAEDYEVRLEELEIIAYDNIGSLASLAAAISEETAVVTVTNVSRDITENEYPFDDPSMVENIFTPTILEQGETSIPLLYRDGHDYLFVRAARYQPARQQLISEVISTIESLLQTRQLAEYWRTIIEIGRQEGKSIITEEGQAVAEAQSALDELLDEATSWSDAHTLAFDSDDDEFAESLSRNDFINIFYSDLSHLPTYAVSEHADGIKLFRIANVIPGVPDELESETVTENALVEKNEVFTSAYLDFLSGLYDIEIFQEEIERVDPQRAAEEDSGETPN